MRKLFMLLILGFLLISFVSIVLSAQQQNQGLEQTIQNKVKAGIYTSETGEQIKVSEMAQNKIKLQVGGVEAETDLEIEEETEENGQGQNKTKLQARLSNGRNAEIKIMPDTASERALERLRLRVCSSENNCTIELKEVPVRSENREERKLAYEIQAQRHFRILALFRARAQVKAQIDAETGEVIQVKKPWWAFLATEPEE